MNADRGHIINRKQKRCMCPLAAFLFAHVVEHKVDTQLDLSKLTEEQTENIREFLSVITDIFDELQSNSGEQQNGTDKK